MAEARLKRIDRSQSYWRAVDVEGLIAADHLARAIWELSGKLDLGAFLSGNKSVAGQPGAERTDPRLLLSVWVYGMTLGIGAARELARRMEQEPGLRWLCADEVVNHHTLSDFRVEHGEALDELFSQVLAALSQAGMVKLEQLTVDGTKVQAQASSGSFRREPSVRERLQQAAQVVAELQREGGDEARRNKREAAQQRAAEERRRRLEQALTEVQEIGRSKPAGEREQARVSVSEPEARIMKNGQGGFAPSYNVQTVTDAAHKIVVSVEVSAQASDQQQLPAALQRIAALRAERPQILVDGGYLTAQSITAAAHRGVELIGPAQNRAAARERNQRQALEQAGIDAPFAASAFRVVENGAALECPAGRRLARISQARNYDQYRAAAQDCAACSHRAACCPRSGQRSVKVQRANPVVEAFHHRMQQPECTAIYKRRGEIAEFPHAWWKEKFGLRKFHLRGLVKVGREMKWAAVAYNIQQWARLVWRPAQAAA